MKNNLSLWRGKEKYNNENGIEKKRQNLKNKYRRKWKEEEWKRKAKKRKRRTAWGRRKNKPSQSSSSWYNEEKASNLEGRKEGSIPCIIMSRHLVNMDQSAMWQKKMWHMPIQRQEENNDRQREEENYGVKKKKNGESYVSRQRQHAWRGRHGSGHPWCEWTSLYISEGFMGSIILPSS